MRTFVAVDPSAEVRARLVALRRELASTDADVRWVRDEALHCTVKFLGDVDTERIGALQTAIAAAVAVLSPFDVRVRGCGAFPAARSARVVWAGLEGEALPALARIVDASLALLGFARESRPFRAHVTLGRVRSRRGIEALAAALPAHADDDLGPMRVDHVVLYGSQLQRGGSIYTPLQSLPLRAL